MRTIAELPHPDCKITIFSMNQKFIVKFEQGALEQTYKISELDVTGGVDGVFQLIDDEFIKAVLNLFKDMNKEFTQTYNRHEY
ncbi:hypothetical protein [Albibacterium profundi]|uniref:Uncharacterized protein n=1 Tax=Albibacterium profundi TaxID=3134906 RepID=A0ABV5CKP1_9SPHI